MEDFIKLGRLKFIDAENPASSENIFMEVSRLTGARIQWENGCKVAPFKKEPCIRLFGSELSVKWAKELLLDKMEVQSNRVIMKIDIAHYEHPSLIGKSGRLIKKIMELSSCHIHFPDGNKFPTYEKSNQVSISGEPLNVEKARLMLRALIPVQIFFEIPCNSNFQSVLHPGTPEVKRIEQLFGLLMFSIQGENGIVVVLRCNQDKFTVLRKEIPLLMELLCGRKGYDLPPVYIITDMMPKFQSTVRGNNDCNLEEIKKKTGANILFPDLHEAKNERNSILISGNLDSVYMAWQELMNIVPISVSFDVNCTREIKGDYMSFLEDLGVYHSTLVKAKYHVQTVTLKGPEKLSKLMLQYHHHLLRLSCPNFEQDNGYKNQALRLLNSTEYYRSTYNAIPPTIAKNLSGRNQIMSMRQNLQASNYFSESVQMSDMNSSTVQNNNWAGSSSQNQDTSGIDYHELKVLAARAMRRTIDSQESLQVPSNIWSGYGFSQSMPASVIRDHLERINQYSYNSFDNSSIGSSADSETWNDLILRDSMTDSIWTNRREGTFSHSNYFDFQTSSPPVPPLTPRTDSTENFLAQLLWQNNLQNYYDLFVKQEVDYEAFLAMTGDELSEMGIPTNAMRKMVCIIKEIVDGFHVKSRTFNAAPGAEREADRRRPLSGNLV